MERKVFAFRHRKEIILESSSGGAFTAMADIVINSRHGVVYGACFNDKLQVVHQRAETLKECKKFRGSKYVQSFLGNIFSQVEKDLRDGYNVLFTGTPCQIMALKKYCGNRNVPMETLVLVDIICHGVMNPCVWEKFKAWIEEKQHSNLRSVSFRYKKVRWSSYPIRLDFENGKKHINTFIARRFNALFFSAVALLDGCYKCPFANIERISDITIGDFWGIEKVMPKFPSEKGVSEIIVNSKKGMKLVNDILKIDGVIYDECLTDDYIKYQHNLNKPTNKPNDRDYFKEDIKTLSFSDVLKRYADYNILGFIRHCVKKILGEIGVTNWIKRHI